MSGVNDKIVNAVELATSQVLGPGNTITDRTSVARQVGDAVAYQAVSQSTAAAIQDAAAYMRNLTTMTEAAMAVVITKIMENPSVNASVYEQALEPLKQIAEFGVTYFGKVGKQAADVANEYPAAN